ncbi:Panacea domain-containing protein [Streptomyces mirabilis]
MKFVYYCQAWHLAWEGRALFPEAIRAWASGPVCPALYELHPSHFEIEAGFFAKRLRAQRPRNRLSTSRRERPSPCTTSPYARARSFAFGRSRSRPSPPWSRAFSSGATR